MENKKEEPKKDAGGLFDAPTKPESMANPNGMKKPEEQPTQEKPKEETGVAVNQPSKHSLAPVNNQTNSVMNNVKQTVKTMLSNDSIKKRFDDILKENASAFTANLSIMVSNSSALSKCEPVSVISSAIISASLKLPLDTNLGFAAIVPYGDKATFQIMYKGLIQLAQRSGQYKTIGTAEVYEGQLVSEDPLRGYVFDWNAKKSDKIVGYAAYFMTVNGFEKTVYWPTEKVKKHAGKYSQMYKRNSGLWFTDFDSMALKTVLKNLLSKWGILSIEMQRAITFDQSVPSSTEDDANPIYTDAIEVGNVEEANEKMKAIIEAGTEGENENNQK